MGLGIVFGDLRLDKGDLVERQTVTLIQPLICPVHIERDVRSKGVHIPGRILSRLPQRHHEAQEPRSQISGKARCIFLGSESARNKITLSARGSGTRDNRLAEELRFNGGARALHPSHKHFPLIDPCLVLRNLATIDPARYSRDIGNVTREIIDRLAGAGAKLDITIDIQASKVEGFDEGEVRTISENARVLKFDPSSGFEAV